MMCTTVDQLGPAWHAETAVVVGTAWGCVASTHRFTEDLREHGDAGGSPAAFTASVHHHPAGVLGELLNLHGPVATISSGGSSGLAALRWALLMVGSGRAPEAMVIAADLANPWVSQMAAVPGGCPFPIGGGVCALRVGLAASGRLFGIGARGEGPWCDAGGATPAEERAFAAAGERRRSAAAIHRQWWPSAALAAVAWDAVGPCDVRERGGRQDLDVWIGRQP